LVKKDSDKVNGDIIVARSQWFLSHSELRELQQFVNQT
jgi:hypothetical protein